jgi:hypothetical protein
MVIISGMKINMNKASGPVDRIKIGLIRNKP